MQGSSLADWTPSWSLQGKWTGLRHSCTSTLNRHSFHLYVCHQDYCTFSFMRWNRDQGLFELYLFMSWWQSFELVEGICISNSLLSFPTSSICCPLSSPHLHYLQHSCHPRSQHLISIRKIRKNKSLADSLP